MSINWCIEVIDDSNKEEFIVTGELTVNAVSHLESGRSGNID